MVPGPQGELCLFSKEHRPQRQPAAQALGRGNHVGGNAVVHVGIEFAGAAVSGLDLIHHEKDVLLFAEGLKAGYKVLLQGNHAAFPLDALNHHGSGLVLQRRGLHGFQVVGRGVHKARRQGLEQLMVMVLPGGGQGCQCAAVKTVDKGDDGKVFRSLFIRGVLAGRLDGALIRLGAGIAEEDLLHAGFFAQGFRQQGAGLSIIEVRHVLQLPQLGGDCRLPFVIGDAEGGYADAAAHVDVFLSGLIVHQRAFPLNQLHREAGVGVRHILFINLLQIHHSSVSSPYTMVPAPSSVRISIRIEWGTRPSMIMTFSTPR